MESHLEPHTEEPDKEEIESALLASGKVLKFAEAAASGRYLMKTITASDKCIGHKFVSKYSNLWQELQTSSDEAELLVICVWCARKIYVAIPSQPDASIKQCVRDARKKAKAMTPPPPPKLLAQFVAP